MSMKDKISNSKMVNWARRSEGLAVFIVGLIFTVITYIPTGFGILIYMLIDPTGFTEKIIVLALLICTVGAVQLFFFIFWVMGLIALFSGEI